MECISIHVINFGRIRHAWRVVLTNGYIGITQQFISKSTLGQDCSLPDIDYHGVLYILSIFIGFHMIYEDVIQILLELYFNPFLFPWFFSNFTQNNLL